MDNHHSPEQQQEIRGLKGYWVPRGLRAPSQGSQEGFLEERGAVT